MRKIFNILLTFPLRFEDLLWLGFLSHVAPPKHAESGASITAAPPASLYVQCGAESLLLAGCSSAEPVSSSALQGTKLIKCLSLCHSFFASLWLGTDKTILVFYTGFNNGESLSEEFIRHSDDCEFPRFAALPEAGVCLLARLVVTARRHRRHEKEAAQRGVAVAVDVSPVVYRCTGLLVCRGKSEITGKLLGVVEVGKSGRGNDQSGGQCNADALYGCKELELTIEFLFGHIGKLFLQQVYLLLKICNDRYDSSFCRLIGYRQHLKGLLEGLCGHKLLLELSQHGTFLLEEHQRLSRNPVGSWLHPFPVEGDKPCIRFVSFSHREHHSCEVFNLKRVFHTDRYAGFGKKIEEQCAIRSGGLHDAVTLIWECTDKFADTRSIVSEIPDFPSLVGGVGNRECRLTDVNAYVSHNLAVCLNHQYISNFHCEIQGQQSALMNYPVFDVKAPALIP